jgi:glycosyltransferase involved in cell wall biosynthesis
VATSFRDPRIHVLRQPRAGVSAARNRGIAEAGRSDAFLFLDADDWLAPAALSTLVDTLTASPWAIAACGRYARIGLDGRLRPSGKAPNGDVLEVLLTRNLFANGGHVLVAADALAEAGGYDPRLTYGEDWELWIRLAQLGEFAAAPVMHPLLFVRERPESATFTQATTPDRNEQVLDVIYGNEMLRHRPGRRRLAELRRLAQAETSWALGKSLIHHGARRDGCYYLLQAAAVRPSLKRICLLALSAGGIGPFRPCTMP